MKSYVLVNKSSAGTELIVERARWKILHITAFIVAHRNTVRAQHSVYNNGNDTFTLLTGGA